MSQFKHESTGSQSSPEEDNVLVSNQDIQNQPPPRRESQAQSIDSSYQGTGLAVVRFRPGRSQSQVRQQEEDETEQTHQNDDVTAGQQIGRKANGHRTRRQRKPLNISQTKASNTSSSLYKDGMRRGRRGRETLKENKELPSSNLFTDTYDDSYEETGYTYGTGPIPSMQYQTKAGSHKPSLSTRRFGDDTSRSRIRRQNAQSTYNPRPGIYKRSYPSSLLPRSPSPYHRETTDPVNRIGFRLPPKAIEWRPADHVFPTSSWSSRRAYYAKPQRSLKQSISTEPGLRRPLSYERLRQGSTFGQRTEDSWQANYNSGKPRNQDQTFEHPLRHDTTDWDESQGSGKRIRYNILLRLRNIQVSDMEKGYSQDDYIQDRSRRNRNTFHARSTPFYPQEDTEMIQTRWIADDDSNEILTLTTKNDDDGSDGQGNPPKIRWVHFTTDSPDLNSFIAQTLRISGLDSHDKALVLRLLKKVETQSERSFFHGRYFDPVTLTYDAEDDDRNSRLPPISATFISMPFFTAQTPYRYETTAKDALHPVRALLQTRYRLQSTVRRDKAQVITESSTSSNLGFLHVPQLWALVINRRTIITCAAFSAALLRADTIKTLLHSKAKADQAAWSIRFTSLLGKELIRHIGDNCLEPSEPYSEYWIEELADHDSCYEILDETSGQIVSEETWPTIIASKDPKVISLLLLEKRRYPRDRENLLTSAISGDIRDFSSFDSDISSSDLAPEASSDTPGNETESVTILAAAGNNARTPVVFQARGPVRGRSSRRSSRSPRRRFKPRPKSEGYDAPYDTGKMALIRRSNADHRFTSANKFETRSLDFPRLTWPDSYSNRDTQDYPIRPVSDTSYYKGIRKGSFSNAAYGLSTQRKTLLDRASHSRIRNPSMLYYVPSARRAPRASSKTSHGRPLHSSTAGHSRDRRVVKTGSTDEVIPERDLLNLNLEKTASPAEMPKLSSVPTNDADTTTPDTNITSSLGINTTATPSNRGYLLSELKDSVQPTCFPIGNLTSMSDSSRSSGDNILGAMKEKHLYKPFFLWPIWRKSAHGPTRLESGNSQHDKSEARASLPTEWLPEAASSMEANSILYNILEEICDRLGKSKISQHFDIYRSLPFGEEADAAMTMLNLRNKQNSQGDTDTRENHCCTEKETILVLASKMLRAFVPDTCHAEILKKYWGGVQSILTFEEDEIMSRSAYIEGIATDFRELWNLIRNIHRGVGDLDKMPRTQYRLPKALLPAFQQLIVYLAARSAYQNAVDLSQRVRSSKMVEDSFFECKDSLLMARNQLLLMVHTADYRESAGFEAIEPEALLAVIMSNLLNISHVKGSFDLTEIYTEHAAKLTFKTQKHSSVRVYEDIKMMSEELDAIKSIVNQQVSTLWDYKKTIGKSNGSLDLCHRVLDRMLAQLGRRLDEFEELQHQAGTAREWAAQSISLKAESNGRAILTFTVVTIVFLPLSFVASFLGMNTADIRGMDSNQDLFWAIGMPLTCSILSLALLVAYREQVLPQRISALWKADYM